MYIEFFNSKIFFYLLFCCLKFKIFNLLIAISSFDSGIFLWNLTIIKFILIFFIIKLFLIIKLNTLIIPHNISPLTYKFLTN